jgi:hypothetical protein
MVRSKLPFSFHPSAAARETLGADLERVALMAVKAVLKNHKSVEVAHQQIRYGGHALAFSSRVTALGDLVVDIDVGDPRLAHHLILEDELRSADRKAREGDSKVREAERRLRRR